MTMNAVDSYPTILALAAILLWGFGNRVFGFVRDNLLRGLLRTTVRIFALLSVGVLGMRFFGAGTGSLEKDVLIVCLVQLFVGVPLEYWRIRRRMKIRQGVLDR